MILMEWNTEDAIAYAREEGWKEVLKLIQQGFSLEEIKMRLGHHTSRVNNV